MISDFRLEPEVISSSLSVLGALPATENFPVRKSHEFGGVLLLLCAIGRVLERRKRDEQRRRRRLIRRIVPQSVGNICRFIEPVIRARGAAAANVAAKSKIHADATGRRPE